MPYGFLTPPTACPPVPGGGTPSPFGGWQLAGGGATALAWQGIAWSPTLALFAAVGTSGANRCATSPDGINWTIRILTNTRLWQKVAWSPALGLFCACAQNNTGTDIATSPDGINWTLRVSPAVPGVTNWFDIAWSEALGLFVVVGGVAGIGIGNHIITSPDGINWTARVAPSDNAWRGVAAGLVGGVPGFVAVAGVGSGALTRVMTSTDGIIWLQRANANANNWEDVVYSPDLALWAAVAGGTVAVATRIMTSPDGITWTTRASPDVDVTHNLTAVQWSPSLGLFLGCSGGTTVTGQRFFYSFDGITWTLLNSPADINWEDIAWSPALARFVVIAATGTQPFAVMT